MRKDYDGYIFDLDGTLWDATENICRVWNDTLLECGCPTVTLEEIRSVMGLPMDALIARIIPSLSAEKRAEVGERCELRENAYLAAHGGVAYPHLHETLAALSERAPLFIVSNCQKGYIEAFLQAHGTGKYFTGRRCFGDNGAQKGENIRRIADEYGLKNPVYIGDTVLDQRGAVDAGVPFIHAAYGFGKVDADERIRDLWELV